MANHTIWLRSLVFVGYLVLVTMPRMSLGREWIISKTNETIDAELLSGSPGTVQLKRIDGTVEKIPITSLSRNDQRFARSRLGMQLIDFSGIWRSSSGSYYAIAEGDDQRFHLRLLESPSLVSVEGVLSLRDRKIISLQWLVVMKNDRTRQARDTGAEFYMTPDGETRSRFAYIFLRPNGIEDKGKRRKVSGAFVKLAGDQIPQRIIDRVMGDGSDRLGNAYEQAVGRLVTVVAIDWYSKQRKISVKDAFNGRAPRDSLSMGEVLVNALARGARNRMISVTVQSAFPLFTQPERLASISVIHAYLGQKERLEKLDRDDVEEWIRDQLLKHPGIQIEEMTRFIRFIADAHDQVKRSFVSVLP